MAGGLDAAAVDTPAHRALARDAAAQSLVLLTNARGAALPLRRGASVALVGALGAEAMNQLGNYATSSPPVRRTSWTRAAATIRCPSSKT